MSGWIRRCYMLGNCDCVHGHSGDQRLQASTYRLVAESVVEAVSLDFGVGEVIEVGRFSTPGQRQRRLELASASLSFTHARIGSDGTGIFVTDVGTDGRGSRNGTYVNGKRIGPGLSEYVAAG